LEIIAQIQIISKRNTWHGNWGTFDYNMAETIFTSSAQFRAHVLQRYLIMPVNVCTKST